MGDQRHLIDANSDVTHTEREILNVLRSVKGYPFDYPADLEHIRRLAVDFPTLDLLSEAKKWATYKLDKPLGPRSNPRLQFRVWCGKACDFAAARAGKPGARSQEGRQVPPTPSAATLAALARVAHIYGAAQGPPSGEDDGDEAAGAVGADAV